MSTATGDPSLQYLRPTYGLLMEFNEKNIIRDPTLGYLVSTLLCAFPQVLDSEKVQKAIERLKKEKYIPLDSLFRRVGD